MSESPQGVPPQKETGKIDWESFFNPMEFDEPARLFMRRLMTAPFEFESHGVRLVQLAENGSLFGTPDRQHTYTREQIAIALEMRIKLIQLARCDGNGTWTLTDDIDSHLALSRQPDLCVEEPSRFVQNGHLAQSPDQEGGCGESEDTIAIMSRIVRDFKEGVLPTPSVVEAWVYMASGQDGRWHHARREIRKTADQIKAVLEAQDRRERRDGSSGSSDEIAAADEAFARDMLKRMVDLSLVGGEEPRQPTPNRKGRDLKDLKN